MYGDAKAEENEEIKSYAEEFTVKIKIEVKWMSKKKFEER